MSCIPTFAISYVLSDTCLLFTIPTMVTDESFYSKRSADGELHAGEHASVDGRYKAVRAAMTARDREDKQAQRELRQADKERQRGASKVCDDGGGGGGVGLRGVVCGVVVVKGCVCGGAGAPGMRQAMRAEMKAWGSMQLMKLLIHDILTGNCLRARVKSVSHEPSRHAC